MRTKTASRNWVLLLGVISTMMIATVGSMGAEEPQDHQDRINSFNVGTGTPVVRSAWPYEEGPPAVASGRAERRSVGSALSANAGIGRGVSVDRTWDDAQWTVGQGRQIAHYWNGLSVPYVEAGVHFAYLDMPDTLPGWPFTKTGYNAYDATVPGIGWPLAQNVGCDLQVDDTIGFAASVSMDVLPNGRVVVASTAAHSRTKPNGNRLIDNLIYYQGATFDCFYDPMGPFNTTWVDSTVYRPFFLNSTQGRYAQVPQVVTQWDGTNTIVHLMLGEDSPGQVLLDDPHLCMGIPYYSFTYFRKVGNDYTGTWSAGKVIDSMWFPWVSLAAAPYPHAGVAVTYTNATVAGGLLNNKYDLDVWLRESLDRGLTWGVSQDRTNYQNGTANHPNHFTAWLETQTLYSTDGDLHVVWTATPTSSDPYLDGFNWNGFNENVYHWSRSSNEILFVANGSYDYESFWGEFSTLHCGYGGSNAGYIANVNISQCNDKLYCIWNQIHERANRFPWRNSPTQPAPGVLDDCSYTGYRLAMANWEILMSVKRLGTSDAWDIARNITNTYTPNCGLEGDPDPENQMRCGSEYKPSVERYGLDETGLGLTWPSASVVDLSPGHDYSGNFYLNMQYVDDQFPGPAFWGRTNPPGTLNSIKWIRLACVEPEETSHISVAPEAIGFPEWVRFGENNLYTITIVNHGNAPLNVTDISTSGGAWLTVSEHPTPGSPLVVPAGVNNTDTFDATISSVGLSTNQWLDGEITLQSDGVNDNGYGVGVAKVTIHVLAADALENPFWDTVVTHEQMFVPFGEEEGECVALAVSNFGEIGLRGSGSANLDYMQSGKECGPRDEDAVYLASGSPFVILASSSDGADASLTCSYNDRDQTDVTGWDPIGTKGTMTGGLNSVRGYDSVYTGRFVNRDTTIAMERIFYAPRSTHPATDTIDFVICYTKFYSGDGQPHNHVTVGNVIDWNVPSELALNNTAGVSTSGGFVYVQGTDTTGVMSCQSHVKRFAAEAFGGGCQSEECWSNCFNRTTFQGQNALIQTILNDTSYMRDGTPLIPAQPDPLVWWNATGTSGMHGDPTMQNQAIWLTYKHDFTLAATDTFSFWTILTTVRDGTLAQLETQVKYAKHWYIGGGVRGCCPACCAGRVGNVNGLGSPPNEVTISDIQLLVTAKYIVGSCAALACLDECDVNQSGGYDPHCSDITISDIQTLVNHLFICGPVNCPLKPCPC